MADLPLLQGVGVTLRPGRAGEAEILHQILSEASVMRWWGHPETVEALATQLAGDDEEVLFVIEVDGEVAGGIQYSEETEPNYRHAAIDIFVATRFQGRGVGTEAVRGMARYLLVERGHHRITIDPAADNQRAISAYAKIGFRPVGIMRQYERGLDGTYHDGLLMDLLAEEFRDAPA